MKVKSATLIAVFCISRAVFGAVSSEAAEPSGGGFSEKQGAPAPPSPVLSTDAPLIPDELKEKVVSLEDETERLVKYLADQGPHVIPVPETPGEVSSETPKSLPPRINIYKELARIRALKHVKKSDKTAQRVYRDYKLNEGDSLYRVAISDKLLTIDEMGDIAVTNSLPARAIYKKVDVARAKLAEARRALFPTVQAVTEFNGGKAQGNSTNLGGRLYKGKNRKLNVSQPVFYGGELVMTVKQAEANLKSTEEEYRKGTVELRLQAKSDYYSAVKSEYNLYYQQKVLEETETIYKRVRQERQKKVVSEIDYMNVESQYYQVFFQVESSKNDLISAKLALFHTMGVDPEEELALDLHLNFKKVELDLHEALETALARNSEIRIKEYALDSALLGIKIYKAKKLPKVDLRGSFGYLGEVFKDTQAIASDNHDLDLEKEWFLGMTASMPLGPNSISYEQVKHKYGPTILALTGSEDWKHKIAFNLFDSLSDITDEKNAEAAYLQALADLDKAKNDAINQVKEEYYNLQKSLIQIDSSLAKMRFQKKQMAAYRYLVGLQEQPVSSLIDGLIDHAQEEFAFIGAVADYHMAVASLNVAMGDPEHFQSRP